MDQYTTHIGLDVHVNSIVAAACTPDGVATELGAFDNTPAELLVRIRRWAKRFGGLHVVYEAGPCGYEIYRQLVGRGIACDVVAPSLIPRRPGQRVKTDRRDAVQLARLSRYGELTAVWVPDPHHEAIRELVRCRHDLKCSARARMQQITAMLHRHGRRWDRCKWTGAHRRWVRQQRFDDPARQATLEHYWASLTGTEAEIHLIEQEMTAALADWSLASLVAGFMAMRGYDLIAAMVLVSELGDITRFDRAEELMSFVGLVPTEHSSGSTRRQGRISKAGNTQARRVLVEAAWAYRHRPGLSAAMQKRSQHVSAAVRAIAWKAQSRLHRRYQRFLHRGKNKNQITTAIARESVGFLWAIAHQVRQEQGDTAHKQIG